MPTAGRRPQGAALVAMLVLGSTPALALEAGKPMPELGVTDLHGKRVDRASLEGKVVLIDFWATWCAPCKQELPVLQRLQTKYAKHGLVVIAISVDSDADKVRAFVKRMGLSLRVIHDADHALAERYGPTKMPSSYLVDREGRVRRVHAGYRKGDARKLEAGIRSLL